MIGRRRVDVLFPPAALSAESVRLITPHPSPGARANRRGVPRSAIPYNRTEQYHEALGPRILDVLPCAATTPEGLSRDPVGAAHGLSPRYIEAPLYRLVADGRAVRSHSCRGRAVRYWRPE